MLGSNLPCALHILSEMSRIQGPGWTLLEIFLRIVFALSNLKDKINIFHRQRAGLLPLAVNLVNPPSSVFLSWNTTHQVRRHLGPPVLPHGTCMAWGTDKTQQHAHALLAVTTKDLCIWPRSLVSSVNIHGNVTGKLISLKNKAKSQTLNTSWYCRAPLCFPRPVSIAWQLAGDTCLTGRQIESWLCHWLLMWLWVSYLTSQDFWFLLCGMEIILPITWTFHENRIRKCL